MKKTKIIWTKYGDDEIGFLETKLSLKESMKLIPKDAEIMHFEEVVEYIRLNQEQTIFPQYESIICMVGTVARASRLLSFDFDSNFDASIRNVINYIALRGVCLRKKKVTNDEK